MHICIFQTGEPLHIDSGNYRPMRAISLANKLIEFDHKVTLISSSFFHQRKSFRSRNIKTIKINKNLDIVLIPSIGYKRHIGIKRILDHINLALNLNKFLKKSKNFNPDKIFLGYPPIETSLVILNWSLKNNIPLMLDVKDNWPINFIDPFPKFVKPFIRIIFFPYFLISKRILKKVKNINSISEEFNQWIKYYSKNSISKFNVTPLVREPIRLSKNKVKKSIIFWSKKNINILEKKHFSFVGSLTNSFDFDFILNSAAFLNKIYPDYKFIICGTGNQYYNLLKRSRDLSNVYVLGEINKYNAKVLIKNSLATLAPYQNTSNFKKSIPNKVIESLENGVPFITNLRGKLEKMVNFHKNGIFISELNQKGLNNYLKLIKEENFKKDLIKNAKKSYIELFEYNKFYNKLVKEICEMK